jgi:hypothetical protein
MINLCEDKYEFEEKNNKRIFDSPLFRFIDVNLEIESFPNSRTSFINIKRNNELELNKSSFNSRNSSKSENFTISQRSYYKLAIFNINIKNSENNINNMDSVNKKDTKLTSKENFNIIINQTDKKFKTQKIYKIKRIDYAIKHYKVYLSKFLKNHANDLIQKSPFSIYLKRKKLYLPNYNSFTGNTKEQDNYDFLNFSVIKILGYYKENEQKNSLQIKNINYIEEILNYIKKHEHSYLFYEIIDFFNMSIEQANIMFYDSSEFKKYCSDKKTLELDKEFRKQKGFSLSDKYGFIKYAKMGNKNNII